MAGMIALVASCLPLTYSTQPVLEVQKSTDGMGNWTQEPVTPEMLTAEGKILPEMPAPGEEIFYRLVVAEGAAPTGFSLIPAGSFMMGSPSGQPGAASNQTPQHQVTLTRPFFMQQVEVTNAQMVDVLNWALGQGLLRVVSTSVYSTPLEDEQLLMKHSLTGSMIDFTGSEFTIDPGMEDFPCTDATWYGAMAYCYYRSAREGLIQSVDLSTWTADLDVGGYRLPTEAEWEYACRAGTITGLYSGDILQFTCDPLDSNLDPVGWYCGNSGAAPHAVGQKLPNSWGLYDMHGNVNEWALDNLDPYPEDPVVDPILMSTIEDNDGCWRGGAWSYSPPDCRSAFHGHGSRNIYQNKGLRPVRTVLD
jgi:formylglycine-generating enzyme required for sulfatase activity